MSPREFARFWTELNQLRARRIRFHPDENERELLARIRKPFAAELKRDMQKLVPKLEAETLTQKECERLRDITFLREKWHAERMRALVDIANLRGMSLAEIMSDLGIKLPEDA
jgi:hypothetical protein